MFRCDGRTGTPPTFAVTDDVDDAFPEGVLDRIAAAARTLEENFRPAAPIPGVPPPDGLPAAWQPWGETVAPGFPEAFALRLAWDGFTPARWRDATEDEAAPRPAWTEWLRAAGRAAREPLAGPGGTRLPSSGEELFPADDPDLPPFVELWLPFLEVGREAVSRRLPPGVRTRISGAAWREAERDFLAQLGALADRCAYAAFDRFRAGSEPADEGENRPPRVTYERFVHRLLADGLVGFFQEVPVLARQVCRFTEDWVENLVEMLRRLAEDAEALAEQFSAGEALGPVVALRPGLSDRHHGGRQAAALTFAGGLRLLYKPKDLRQDAALAGWTAWFSTHGVGEENVPPVARVLARGGDYGWMEFIAGDALETPAEAARYHRRAGALLAFVHALGGNDCVMDNVIATRAGPVLIDVETLFQPRAATASGAGGGALRGARQLVGDSVLRTGLLPTWQRTPDGTLYDVSGLAGEGGQDTGYRRLAWRGLNTDAMRPEREVIRRPPQANLPRDVDGGLIPVREHLDALEEGFRRAVDAMIAHRAALLGPDGLLRRLFAGCRTRFLLRPTYVYSVLLQSWSPPSRWRSGPERGMGFECLVRPFVQRASPGPPPPLWPLLRREREALERHDIPHFPIAADSADLVLTGSGRGKQAEGPVRVPGVFAESGLDAAAGRLRGLSSETLEAQVGFLRAAFLRPREGTGMVGAAAPVPESRAELDATVPLDAAALLALAGRLADEVAATAVPSGEEAVVWLSPNGLRLDDEALRGGNLYLYDGNCGVALFLAAAEAVSGGPRSEARRELIARACRPMTTLLETSSGDETAKGPGICVGVGAAVYTFTRIAGFLVDSTYLERAAQAAAVLTPERIAADRTHDVFHGTAGAILALLGLHRATGEGGTAALQTALRCGRHLVSHQQPARAGGAAWAVVHGWMPVGLAHGAAGIALALARLGAAAGTDEFLEPVRQALRYERALYRADALNWPVVNVPDGAVPPLPVFLNAWCNGAAGIGLSRLAMLDLLPAEDAAESHGEIETALRKNRLGGLPRVDFPCCGNFGRIEFLQGAGRRLARPEAEEEARRRATLAVRRAEANGGRFSLGTDPADDRCFQPGFFRGLSGIGYGLLRLAEPEKVPSVLLFA